MFVLGTWKLNISFCLYWVVGTSEQEFLLSREAMGSKRDNVAFCEKNSQEPITMTSHTMYLLLAGFSGN
jgi:hypothetical protein